MRFVYVLAIREEWDEPIIESFVAESREEADIMFEKETDLSIAEMEAGEERGEVVLIVKSY